MHSEQRSEIGDAGSGGRDIALQPGDSAAKLTDALLGDLELLALGSFLLPQPLRPLGSFLRFFRRAGERFLEG